MTTGNCQASPAEKNYVACMNNSTTEVHMQTADESVDHYLAERQAMYQADDRRVLPVPQRVLTVAEMLLANAQAMVAIERRLAAHGRAINQLREGV